MVVARLDIFELAQNDLVIPVDFSELIQSGFEVHLKLWVVRLLPALRVRPLIEHSWLHLFLA